VSTDEVALTIVAGLTCAAAVIIVVWIMHGRQVGHWLQVHTGTINESGPYYGFWSGFGSDLEEFGILGAIGAGLYQLVKKYNCHEPGCSPPATSLLHHAGNQRGGCSGPGPGWAC
jgi:hypothetical protein